MAQNAKWLIWHHPEHGDYELRSSGMPDNEYEGLYFEALKALLLRKWKVLFRDPPYPDFRRAVLFDVASGQDAAQALIVDFSRDPRAGITVKPGRVKASLEKNGCLCLDVGRNKLAVSPFFAWELAEFWEGGHFDED